jgi:hypothetical protein
MDVMIAPRFAACPSVPVTLRDSAGMFRRRKIMGKRVWAPALVLVVALSAVGAPDQRLRDGFFGISGIIPDFTYFDELRVECATSGFWIGPSAGFVGSNKEALHTRQMRDFVRYGITPIATFYLGNVDAGATDAARTIVEYYTSGKGAIDVGAPVLYWEVGDEENGVWGTSCAPEEYARRVAIVASGIRGTCPECRIVMGGLLDGAAMGDMALAPYLDSFLDAGGGEWIDVYAFHYYGLARPSPLSPGDQLYDSAIDIVDAMRAALEAHGAGDAPIWVTEMATFSGTLGPIRQSETEQAADLVKRYVLLRTLGVEKALWTYLTEPQYEGTGEGFFDQAGLIYDGIGPADRGARVEKEGYRAYVHLVNRLAGASLADSVSADGISWARFERGDERVTVLWQDPWVRQGALWVTPAGEVAVENLRGETLSRHTSVFRLDLEIEPVYLVGGTLDISTAAPLLMAP